MLYTLGAIKKQKMDWFRGRMVEQKRMAGDHSIPVEEKGGEIVGGRESLSSAGGANRDLWQNKRGDRKLIKGLSGNKRRPEISEPVQHKKKKA